MPTTCKIDFENNPMKVLYAGQLLRGTVELNLTKNKTVRGVYICINGRAHTSWSERVPRRNHRRSNHRHRTENVWETHTANEDYLNERIYFVGGSSGEIELAPGTYNYNFQFMLPANLPTSIEGQFGHIRYSTQIVLDIPEWMNRTFENKFTVIRGIDLNADPALRNNVVAGKVKKIGILSPRVMIIEAGTPFGGYLPGQTINLQIDVKNGSKEPIYKFTVKLLKQVTFYANDAHVKVEKTVVKEQDAPGCDGNQDKTIRINFDIPSILPTEATGCNIIKVIYMLQVKGSLGLFYIDPVMELPIVIGSFPIQEYIPVQTTISPSNVDDVQPAVTSTYDSISNFPGICLSTHQPSAPPQDLNQNVHSMHPSSYSLPNDDPPTYEEAISNGAGREC